MANVWIYKFDGTIQCDPSSLEIPLDKMRSDLVMIIGEVNVLSMKKARRLMSQLCGMPTGSINVYEITEAGWQLLADGIAGKHGFARLDGFPTENSDDNNLGRLIGLQLRVYQGGDAITKDLNPERCNIELSDHRTIVNVWFG